MGWGEAGVCGFGAWERIREEFHNRHCSGGEAICTTQDGVRRDFASQYSWYR